MSHDNLLINNKQKVKIWMSVLRAIGTAEGAMDVAFATPLRNWQVFGGDSFNLIQGSSTPFLAPLTLALSLSGALPFIARAFSKNYTNNLGHVLKNLKNDLGVEFNLEDEAEKKKLTNKFNSYLRKKGLHHLQAEVHIEEAGFFRKNVLRKKDKVSLKFKHADPVQDFFRRWDNIKDQSMVELVQGILHKPQMVALFPVKKNLDEVEANDLATDSAITAIEGILSTGAPLTAEQINKLFGEDILSKAMNSKRVSDEQKILLLSRLREFFANQQNGKLVDLIYFLPGKSREEYTNKLNEISVTLVKSIFSRDEVTETSTRLLFNLLAEKDVVNKALNTEHFINAKDQGEHILILSRLSNLFVNRNGELINQNVKLGQLRENFINKLNDVSITGALNNVDGTLNDFSYNFWLSFFCNDILDGRADTGMWSPVAQITVLAVTGGLTLLQLGFKLANYFSNRISSSEPPKVDSYLSDKKLKHYALTDFFMREAKEKQLEKAKTPAYKYPVTEDLNDVQRQSLNAHIASILDNRTGSEHIESSEQARPKILKHFNSLRKEYREGRSTLAKRASTIITHAMSRAIGLSFIAWWAGVILIAAGATFAGGVLLCNPVGIVLFAVGAIFGATYFANEQIQADKRKERSIRAALIANADKIAELEKIESQNKELRAILKGNDKELKAKDPNFDGKKVELLTVAKAHDDRTFRRLTTEKGGVLNTVKKGLGYLFAGYDSMGSGVLIIRLTVLPILAMTVSTVVAGPAGLAAALVFGALWCAYNIVKYHQAKKSAKHERTLDDIENRLLAANATQAVYKEQLGYSPKLELEKGKEKTSGLAVVPSSEPVLVPLRVPNVSNNRVGVGMFSSVPNSSGSFTPADIPHRRSSLGSSGGSQT